VPCDLAKEFLSHHGIEFETIDVSEMAAPYERIRELTGGPIGTPAIVIDDEARIGFDREWLIERLKIE
jgi:glutaredoxin